MTVTIPANRKRIPHVLIISCLMIGYLFYVAYNNAKESSIEGPSSWSVYALIIIGLLYYAIIALVEYIKTLFDPTALLIIAEKEIIDNLSIFSCGTIPRDDITDVEVKRTPFAEFLVIRLEDSAKCLQGKNVVQQWVLKQYIKKFGSPIVISDQRVEYNLHELRKLILERKG